MITFLWMLYLALTIWLSFVSIRVLFNLADTNTRRTSNFNAILLLTVAILWSIWYFYFLH